MDITGGPRQIVAARHALQERVAEWKATNNPNGEPEEQEYSLKVREAGAGVGRVRSHRSVVICALPLLRLVFSSCLFYPLGMVHRMLSKTNCKNVLGNLFPLVLHVQIAVPQPLVGHIIGKGGTFVREVLSVTGVQVSVLSSQLLQICTSFNWYARECPQTRQQGLYFSLLRSSHSTAVFKLAVSLRSLGTHRQRRT